MSDIFQIAPSLSAVPLQSMYWAPMCYWMKGREVLECAADVLICHSLGQKRVTCLCLSIKGFNCVFGWN